MAHSYIDYRSRCVQLRDEHIVWLIAAVIKESSTTQTTPELGLLFAWWNSIWHTFGPGCIELPLDKFLQDQKSIGQLIDILKQVESKLRSSGPVHIGEEMNKNVPSNRFHFEDQSTAALCDVIDKVKGMLELSKCDE